MSERTLVLIKPDGVARNLIGEVLSRIERKGLTIIGLELRTLDRSTAEAHYAEHAAKPFFADLVDFITSGPLIAAVVEGPDAIVAWRTMMGATNPVTAAPGHDPRRPGHRDAGERHTRLGLPGVRRPGDRAVLPRPGLTHAPVGGRAARRRAPASRNARTTH